LCVAFGFLLLGLLGKVILHNQDSRTYAIFILISGIFFLILSLSILIDGVEYTSLNSKTDLYSYDNISSDIRTANITTTEFNTYSGQKDLYSYSAGLVFLLLSLFLIFTSIDDLATKQEKE
jgi:hypothetical protein